MNNSNVLLDYRLWLWILGIGLLVTVVVFVYKFVASPFCFPYKFIYFDVSGKRKPRMEDYIDQYLILHKMVEIQHHKREYDAWKANCEEQIAKSWYKKRRRKQFAACLDENQMFVFTFLRKQTRYKQVNYVRHAYTVTNTDTEFATSYAFLSDRFERLKEIDFECVLSKYNAKKQRNLMTPELRRQIQQRDDYTCQVCGKRMPDGVGLHIDHIVPISKGGKTVPSNLQVLCSVCNGSKAGK